jgi:hypothetical protein
MHTTMKYTCIRVFVFLLSIGASLAQTVEKFGIDGAKVSLKIPAAAAAGKPWLWIGEFAGHLKTLESGLVEQGWHVAYVAQGNKFLWHDLCEIRGGRRSLPRDGAGRRRQDGV